ncbi:MAG TPA: peptide chain release factor 1 [Anaerohalosphaeraceae bacterium]|nr:peptide chain release factor 1 [Phycisphaerae bacterium]HOK96672.1 peptide chain release factor 1 [Anaerohalosphaeraceae bacterium]HOL32139.1 peptide chain release factor 1 [Anaerohalosphaeraceae bacterium]HOM76679.1 peptide chain release factor 1 [Anaerohalosphaeraceae bacterium]HPC65069.1 peptide chain release factor 1 [Anaerohalosphaeraceae bacterium]
MSDTNTAVLNKLAELDARCTDIEQQLSNPAVVSDVTRLVSLTKEQGKLMPLVSRYREYKKLSAQLEEAQAILADPQQDAEMRELAESEAETLSAKQAVLLEDIKNTLVMADDASVDSVIMEIRPGTGGEEAALFARDLYQMYTRYADKQGWKIEVMDFSPTEMGGIREVIMNIKGAGVWSKLGYEGGGHRVQRVPETESQGRIHTSAATVAILPEPEEVDVQINPDDVIENVSCAGGPGGQNVNKVASAIRLEHIPTGIVVSMRDERSQHKNRAKAYRILRSRVYEYYKSKADAERSSARKTMIGSGDRSQRIRTYNFPQNRLTDHRINLSLYSLDKIMMGELDELIAALQDYDRQQRLQNL